MTKEDRRYTAMLLLVIVLTIWGTVMMQRVSGQPQNRIDVTSAPGWALLEFENGSQWYFPIDKLDCINAIPAQDAEKLGIKTKLYVRGGITINCPYSVDEINDRVVTAESLFDLEVSEEKEGN